MQTLNVAIAGFGYSARVFHTPFLLIDPRFKVKKILERNSEKALSFFPAAEIVREFSDLLTSEIDLVIITTPNQTHYEMAKSALLAGKNVLVEKPLAATAKQALELSNLAATKGVILSVYQNRRWDNAPATAKKLLESGILGCPVDCEIRFDRYAKNKNAKAWKETGELGTGLVYDLGVHLIDQAIYLFGVPNSVFADIRYQHDNAMSDDNFDIHLYYETGLRVVCAASKFVREAGNAFALHGKLGSYVKASIDPQESLLAENIQPIGDWYIENEANWGILHTEIDGKIIRRAYPNANVSYQDFYDNLYASITEKQPLIVSLEQVILVLHIIEMTYQSAKLGKKVVINRITELNM